jgi:hypothetical protein
MEHDLYVPYMEGIYRTSDEIKIGNISVELIRKQEAEANLKEIISAFGNLITYCEREKS